MKITIEGYLKPALYVLAFLLVGLAIRRIKFLEPLTKPAFRALNIAAIWVILPTVVFISIVRPGMARFQITGISYAGALAFIGLGVCFVLATVFSTLMRFDRKKTVAISLNSAFMNVAYLGLPLVYATVGLEGLGPASIYAVVIGIPHLVLGVALASAAVKKRISPRFVLENVLVFPATFALFAALLFIAFDAYVPGMLIDTFDFYLAKPFFALMLLFVGYSVPLVSPRRFKSELAIVGTIRLLICPIITYALIVAFGLSIATDITPRPALIQATMPPAVFNMILAKNFNLDLKLYGTMVFYLTFISLFVALPLLMYLVF